MRLEMSLTGNHRRSDAELSWTHVQLDYSCPHCKVNYGDKQSTSNSSGSRSGGVGCTVWNKDVGTLMSPRASACLDVREHAGLTTRHDHALRMSVHAIQDSRGLVTILEFAPVARHHTVGPTERTSQAAASQARASRLSRGAIPWSSPGSPHETSKPGQLESQIDVGDQPWVASQVATPTSDETRASSQVQHGDYADPPRKPPAPRGCHRGLLFRLHMNLEEARLWTTRPRRDHA